MGWDPTPRTNQEKPWKGNQVYPYTNTIGNNTPENFKRALQMSFSLFPNAQSTDYAHGYSPFVAYPTAHDESIHKRLLNDL